MGQRFRVQYHNGVNDNDTWVSLDDYITKLGSINLLFNNWDNSLQIPNWELSLKANTPSAIREKGIPIRLQFEDSTVQTFNFDGTNDYLSGVFQQDLDNGFIQVFCQVPTSHSNTYYALVGIAETAQSANFPYCFVGFKYNSGWYLVVRWRTAGAVEHEIVSDVLTGYTDGDLITVKFNVTSKHPELLYRTYSFYVDDVQHGSNQNYDGYFFKNVYDLGGNTETVAALYNGYYYYVGKIIEIKMDDDGEVFYLPCDDIYYNTGYSAPVYNSQGQIIDNKYMGYNNITAATFFSTVTYTNYKTVWKGIVRKVGFNYSNKTYKMTIENMIKYRGGRKFYDLYKSTGSAAADYYDYGTGKVAWIKNYYNSVYYRNRTRGAIYLLLRELSENGLTKLFYNALDLTNYEDLAGGVNTSEGFMHRDYFASIGLDAKYVYTVISASADLKTQQGGLENMLNAFCKLGHIIYYNGKSEKFYRERWQIAKCYNSSYSNLTISDNIKFEYQPDEADLSQFINAKGLIDTTEISNNEYSEQNYKLIDYAIPSQAVFNSDTPVLANDQIFQKYTDEGNPLILNVETVYTDAFILDQYYNNLIEYFVEFKNGYAFARLKLIKDR